VFDHAEARWAAVCERVASLQAAGRPVLIGTDSVADSQALSVRLQAAGIAHEYLEYGSYFSDWRRRNALKMWSGWPTLPLVFVKGTLVGGADDLVALIDSGELKRLLA
jgi:glutaredoxin